MTKIVVIGLEGASIEHLLGDEALVNFRRLAENGSYGPLSGVDTTTVAAWTDFAKNSSILGVDFQYLNWALRGEEEPPASAHHLRRDHELGLFLETLSDDTALLIVSLAPENGQGAFIVNAGNLPSGGELSDASILDLPPTLLALAGVEIPATRQGRSLIPGPTSTELSSGELSDEARQLLLDRLSGLGYI